MKINDVEKITGLTKKAIRLYESKGLINVSRNANGYRNYSEQDVEVLKNIKLFRSVGIPISDIKLYLFGVMSIDELIDKRKLEILKESGKNSEKYHLCDSILNKTAVKTAEIFTESENASSTPRGRLAVGIDIGTTTISAVVYDIDSKKQLEAYTLPHNSYVCSNVFSEQSVCTITEKAEKLLYHILDLYGSVVSIGLSGQMHGITYIDAEGNSVSDLVNWQDKRADIPLENGKNVCQEIFEKTGEYISTGYGIATHYYNMLNGKVPLEAVGFCSIMDYFGMKICGLKKPVIHASVASSFGLFDVKNNCFMLDKLSLLGISKDFLPNVTEKSITIGTCRNIPVSIALGDNQASFLGSVSKNTGTILVNIGTGAQISAVSNYVKADGDIELRPFIEGKYLLCGSSLCGGYAYSMLERFFESYAVALGIRESSQYKIMNHLASTAYENGEKGLLVDVSFFGKRSDPDSRGSVKMIDRENFTPSSLIIGVLKGMCNEIYELYEGFSKKAKQIVASGGAVRNISVLKKLISQRFDAPVSLNSIREETATGVALFSAFITGKISYNDGFSKYIY